MTGHDWDAIKLANPLVDVIGNVVKLRKQGAEYKGLCPFHNEKSPSFTVIPDKGFYHCFGCGAHGDVVDFVAQTQGLSTPDALARLSGGDVKLTPADRKQRDAAMAERDAQQARERAAATARARARWEAAEPATDNTYLARKGVAAHDCRQEGANLLLPIYGPDGEVQSVQTIAPDGGKLFHKGAPTKAGRMMIGIHMGRTIICEGYATGASIHDAVPDQVCIAYSKGNMHVVARELVAQGVAIVLAADTNAADEMCALGRELDCPVAVPTVDKDFNDQAVLQGAGSVADVFSAALKAFRDGPASTGANGDGLPFDLSGIDLRSPPGFVGMVADWIESQSRRARCNLAVAAAISAVGNIAGLRFVDDRDGVTCNLFTFCIAGSRTGKESIQQAMMALHRAAGIIAATHGNIKSEQEIIRNLTRHQAAFYVIDEIGIILQKIKSAQTRGGAAYLEGVIGVLMSAYSKADGFMPLSGDVKEDVRKSLLQEAGMIQRKMDDTPGPGLEARLGKITHSLNTLDNGLERPFLSLMGFTTPETFNDLVDFQAATNGFIGRALLFNERETAPRSKRGFAKPALPDHIAMRLSALYSGGCVDIVEGAVRVENYGTSERIPTRPDASAMLDSALDWFEDQAVAHKGKSGLESLFLGAYELLSKISLILAVADGERLPEHVAWAFALVRRDVDEKMRLVVSNDSVTHNPAQALHARIANVLSGDDGETASVLYNRLRKYKRPDIDEAIADMDAAGTIERIDTGQTYGGKPVVKLRFTG